MEQVSDTQKQDLRNELLRKYKWDINITKKLLSLGLIDRTEAYKHRSMANKLRKYADQLAVGAETNLNTEDLETLGFNDDATSNGVVVRETKDFLNERLKKCDTFITVK
jgi:hypothetical protein